MRKMLTTIAAACGLATTMFAATVNLANLTADRTFADGDVITGRLGSRLKLSIADGATVTLSNASIYLTHNWDSPWAGLTCEGDATIVLVGNNYVWSLCNGYPGIRPAAGRTLTIRGTGSLNAKGLRASAGIGGGYYCAGHR